MALISSSEYAVRHGFAGCYIRRLAQNGRLKATKIGNMWVVDENEPLPERRKLKKKGE